MDLGNVVFVKTTCWGTILTALNKMKQTDQHQYSDGLLQECNDSETQ